MGRLNGTDDRVLMVVKDGTAISMVSSGERKDPSCRGINPLT